jgi:hypothetical protein
MQKPFAVAAIVWLALAAVGSARANTDASDWSDEDGTHTAARLIESCLKVGPIARDANLACVDTAFDACTRQNGGTMSQHDLNVCRRYSYEAWRQRYETSLASFDRLFEVWTQPSADGWQRATAARFRSQEDAWRRWTAADCEMWELGSVGGTIHSYAVATCEERHIARRTIELMPLLEWLESR